MQTDKNVTLEAENFKIKIISQSGDKCVNVNYGSFRLCEGDFVIVKGRNGCGKSTLFKLIARCGEEYYKWSGGTIKVKGRNLPDLSTVEMSGANVAKLQRSIVYIGQEDCFESSATAYSAMCAQAVRAVKYDKELSPAEKKRKLQRVKELVKEYFNAYLKDNFKCSERTFRLRRITGWSGGQQKMLHVLAGIIKAVVCNVKLVMLDEPLNNLDRDNKKILINILSDNVLDGTRTVMIITHCQVFKGINKVLRISEADGGVAQACLTEGGVYCHEECLMDI